MRRLILAYPRSGTVYTAKIVKAHGIEFGHEDQNPENQIDGTISFLELNNTCEFDVVLHQIRDPLKTISSSAKVLVPRSCHQLYGLLDIDKADQEKSKLYRTMLTWLRFNERAEKVAEWRYRIEDIDEVYPELCQRLRIEPKKKFLSKNKNINHRSYPILAWDDLDKEDFDLSQRIKEKAKQYGYNKGEKQWH